MVRFGRIEIIRPRLTVQRALLDILGSLPSRNGIQMISPDESQSEQTSPGDEFVETPLDAAFEPSAKGSSSTLSTATGPVVGSPSDAAVADAEPVVEQFTPLDYQYVTHVGPGRFMAKQLAEGELQCVRQ